MNIETEFAEIRMRRGTIKAFRLYLNDRFPGTKIIDGEKQDTRHRNNQFRQKTRAYGDYLYCQDRDMFNNLLSEAMRNAQDLGGPRYPSWDFTKWGRR